MIPRSESGRRGGYARAAALGTPIERAMKRIDKSGPNGCWIWTGAKRTKSNPYGVISVKDKNVVVSRLVWEHYNGAIPHGMVVCHRCDNPPCCNPEHLFLGTHLDNVRDAKAKGRMRNGTRRGIDCHTAKLTDDIVRLIRASSPRDAQRLAKRYGVRVVTITKAMEGKTWRHVA